MMIQILGTSCPNCKAFYQRVKEVVIEFKLEVEPEYLEDFGKLIAIGARHSPALVVDGQLLLTGYSHSKADIIRALSLGKIDSQVVNDELPQCSVCGGI